MKKFRFILLILLSFVALFAGNMSQVSAENAMNNRGDSSGKPQWWTTDNEDVLSTERLEGTVIRDGMSDIVHNPAGNPYEVQGVITTKINNHQGAVEATMDIIQIIINYALGILSFIALIYLIYHGFLMLSSAGNDKQFDKGKSGIKTAVIALIGIGMSWLIVSLMLWVITQLTS